MTRHKLKFEFNFILFTVSSLILALIVFVSFPAKDTFAQVDPNLRTRLQNAPIIVDHTSIPLFDTIPDTYITRAQNIRMMWGDRSVGGNISDGLACLAFASDEVAPSRCKGYTHNYPQFASPQSWVNWYHPGGYNRSNWTFFFDPGLGVTPQLTCTSNNGMWDGLISCFIEHVRNNSNLYDVFSYQHSYLVIDTGSTIANPTSGYFVNQTGKTDIYDYERLETDFPNKVFFYWTTSLSRSLGSQIGTDYNNQMRQWVRDRHKILFDVADIESHSPNGNLCYDNRDGVSYCTSPTSGNCENYPNDGVNQPAICQNYTTEIVGGHLYDAAKVITAKMYWVLMAQIAGWNPGQQTITPTSAPGVTPTSAPTPTLSPSPTNTPTPIPGDANRDGVVNIADVTYLLQNWTQTVTSSLDQFTDGKINAFDVAKIIGLVVH